MFIVVMMGGMDVISGACGFEGILLIDSVQVCTVAVLLGSIVWRFIGWLSGKVKFQLSRLSGVIVRLLGFSRCSMVILLLFGSVIVVVYFIVFPIEANAGGTFVNIGGRLVDSVRILMMIDWMVVLLWLFVTISEYV